MDSLFVGGALFAAFGGFLLATWNYVRGLAQQLVARLIVSFDADDGARDAVIAYCSKCMTPSAFGPRSFVGYSEHVRTVNRTEIVIYETVGLQGRLYWHGWRPFWLARGSASGSSFEVTAAAARPVMIYTFRPGFCPTQFMIKARQFLNESMHSHFGSLKASGRYTTIYFNGTAGRSMVVGDQNSHPEVAMNVRDGRMDTSVTFSRNYLDLSFQDLGPARKPGGLLRLALSESAQGFVVALKDWLGSRDWFEDRGLGWKLGALFYGAPGNGKTSLVRAVAEEFDLPVYVFNLASMRDDELRRYWQKMLANLPAVALLEDVDNVFDHREPAAGVELHFDCLLNLLDGVERVSGLVTVITTNRPERLDAALGGPVLNADGSFADTTMSTRPGRIDLSVAFDPPDEAGRRLIAATMLKDCPELIDELVLQGHADSGAQFERRCINAARAIFMQGIRLGDIVAGAPHVPEAKTDLRAYARSVSGAWPASVENMPPSIAAITRGL